jgi:hypothetical protein
MLRHCYTAVVERAERLRDQFSTEPYEAGWAREALVFVKVIESMEPSAEVRARVQISPDGVDWVDEGTVFPAIREQGLYFAKVTHFGNWLRVSGSVTGCPSGVRALVYLVLKE